MSLDAVNNKLKEIVGEGGSIVNTLAKLTEKVQESYGAIEAKEGFMANCYAFNATLTLPKLKTMSGGFLKNCRKFNQPLTFSSEMETVGIGMLNGCTAFNQDLYFPSTLKGFATGETSDSGFMYGCISMTSTVTWDVDPSTMYNKNSVSSAFSCNSSTADCYVQGIKVAGTKATEAMTLWPNSTRSPYRNLIAA